MTRVEIGMQAPRFTYRDAMGEVRQLADLWAQSAAMIVWPRHCGCIFYFEQLAQLRESAPRLKAAGARLGMVVQAPAEELADKFGSTDDFVCVPDPEKETHEALGLTHASGLSLLLNGDLRRRRKRAAEAGFAQNWGSTFAKGGDWMLVPGAALVAPNGRLRWIHRGAHVGDAPSTEDLLAVLHEYEAQSRGMVG